MKRLLTTTATALALILSISAPVSALDLGSARSAWTDIRAELYGDRDISAASSAITLGTPYRAKNDLRVPMRVSIALPDGDMIDRVTFIIDENPMPVSADFRMDASMDAFSAEVAMRLNGPTMVRAIVETTAGALLMKEAMVKTSGVGACAAPPITGAEEAMATLGQMELASPSILEQGADHAREVTLKILHPQHSGMQMDQVTLHYILARYVDQVAIWTENEKLFTMTGSISLSEDPEIRFTVPGHDVSTLRARMTDTEGAVFQKSFSIGGS